MVKAECFILITRSKFSHWSVEARLIRIITDKWRKWHNLTLILMTHLYRCKCFLVKTHMSLD